jgi:hypothetical protein
MTWHEAMVERVRNLNQRILEVETARNEAFNASNGDPDNEMLSEKYFQLGETLEDLQEQLSNAQRDEMRAREN